MILNQYKKIISSLLLATLLVSFVLIPRISYAQVAVAEVNSTPSLFQQIAGTLSNAATAFSTYSLEFKAFVLDTLATTLAKQLIRQITASVVNWINSGFEGSPSFLTNPGSFFLDVADQVTGAFLAKSNSPLNSLCSPFSIDIRIALSFKYHPNIPQRYTCTLGTIISNSKNAVQGATINGFTAGDFRQGGWPAFISLTTEPQNNIYGAYLEADSELSIRVANAQIGKKDELNQGKGFLSWRDTGCVKGVRERNKAMKNAYAEKTADYDTTVKNISAGNTNMNVKQGGGEDMVGPQLPQESDCPVQTPGSVIVSSLETSVNGPLHELELVDSINQIVNALAAQLVSQVLTNGLRSVSGSGPSDSSSYINEIRDEAKQQDTTQVGTLRNSFISSVEKYITDTLQFKTNKDQALNLILDVKTGYDGVKSCYDAKIKNSIPALSASDVGRAEQKKTAVDSVVNTAVTPLASRLLTEATTADARYRELTQLRTDATNAKTVNEVQVPSNKFSEMLRTQSLVSARDVVASQQDLADITTTANGLKQDVQRKLQECQIFPQVYFGN